MEIREATALDAEKILEYCKIIGGESDNLTFGPEGVAMPVEAEREFLENMRESANQAFFVAIEGEEIVGAGVLSGFAKPRMAHRGEIALSVKKSMWGKHIGTRLMEEVLRFAREKAKMEILSLEVRCDNERAVALYKKLGFETIGTFEGMMKIQGEWISYYLMRLELVH